MDAVVSSGAPQKYGVHWTPFVPKPTFTLAIFATVFVASSQRNSVTVSPSRSPPMAKRPSADHCTLCGALPPASIFPITVPATGLITVYQSSVLSFVTIATGSLPGRAYPVFVPLPESRITLMDCPATSTSASLPAVPRPIIATLPASAKLMLPGPLLAGNSTFLAISCFCTSMIAVKSFGGELAKSHLPLGSIFSRAQRSQAIVLTIFFSAMSMTSMSPLPWWPTKANLPSWVWMTSRAIVPVVFSFEICWCFTVSIQ